MTTPAEGRRVGPYRIERELARGGMGVVYVAVHEASKARVALKQLHLLQHDAEARTRFTREAEAQAQLDHPAIVRIHAAEFDGDAPYLVQELLPGGSLSQRLAAGPLPLDDALAVVRRVGEALSHAHARGILHRDLKPGNVLFNERGEACLGDFGLAGVAGATERLTATGEVLGTPNYMAPEQASDAKRVDVRADVYGLGALLYACLTGRPPVSAGGGLVQTLHAVLNTPPTPPSVLRQDVPPATEAACLRALAKSPDERYPDVQAFLDALSGEATPPARWPRSALAAGAGAVAVGLGALAAFAGQATPAAAPPAPPPASSAPAEADPLGLALERLEAGHPLTPDAEAAALNHALPPDEAEVVIGRLAALPKSAARDRLWATALARADRLHELATWDGQLAPLPQALRALELNVRELDAFLAAWSGSLVLDRARLNQVAQRLLDTAQAIPGGVAGDLARARAQRWLAEVFGVLALCQAPVAPGLGQRAAELRADGPGRLEVDLALLYAQAKDSLPRQGNVAEAARRLRGELSPTAAHWLAVIEGSDRIDLRNRWGPVDPDVHARLQAARKRVQQPDSGLREWYRTDVGRPKHALALDALRLGWEACRSLPPGERKRRAAQTRAAVEELLVYGNVILEAQMQVVARVMAGDPVHEELLLGAAKHPSGHEAIRAQLALCRPEPDLLAALAHFEASIAADDARSPTEAYLGKLHVRVLLGELTPEQALAHPDVERAASTSATFNAGGFYWHLPERFEETLRGAWWPGRP